MKKQFIDYRERLRILFLARQKQATFASHIDQEISSSLDFYDWYQELEKSYRIEHPQHKLLSDEKLFEFALLKIKNCEAL